MPTETAPIAAICRNCSELAAMRVDHLHYCLTCWDKFAATCCLCGMSDLKNFFVKSGGSYFCFWCAERLTFCEVCRDVLTEGRRCDNCKGLDRPNPPLGSDDYAPKRRFSVKFELSAGNLSAIRKGLPEGWAAVSSCPRRSYVSPTLRGSWGFSEITNFCELARKHGAKVDKQCGLHLHIDASDLSGREIARVVLGYSMTYESFWRRVVPKSRRDDYFCSPFGFDFPTIDDLTRGRLDRPGTCYYWVNTWALDTHGALEIRLHSGTFAARKVINWVKANIKFFEAVREMKTDEVLNLTRKGVETIIGPHLADYYRQREAKFFWQ